MFGVGASQTRVVLFLLAFFSHIYCFNISLQCGRPTEVTVCPECKVNIGGTEHNLLAGNTSAQRYDTVTLSQATGTRVSYI